MTRKTFHSELAELAEQHGSADSARSALIVSLLFAAFAPFAFLVAASAAAQTPSPAVPAQPPFRASTTLVEVDAVVVDGKGRAVTDLIAEDFEVFEEGQPQTIARMYVVRGGSMSAPARPAADPSAYSAVTAAPQRVFVLFFDEDHLTQSSVKRLRDAAEHFLKTEFHDGDVGGILVGAKMAGNRLTSDREALLATIRGLKISASQTFRKFDLVDWPRISETEAIRIALQSDEQVLRQVADRAARDSPEGLPTGKMVDYTVVVQEKARTIVDGLRQPAARTLGAFQALLNGLARIPGRKSVVFITDGFFVEESWAHVRQLVGLAARANVRIYSIDAQGTNRHGTAADLNQMTPLETGVAVPTEMYNTVEEGPNTLAVDTGGYVFRYSNDFASALAGIARESSDYYVLGYSPTSSADDGSFRRIGVRVKRPGLTVRARRGYVATAVKATTAAPPLTQESPAPSTRPEGPSLDASSSSAVAPTAGDTTPADAPARIAPNPGPPVDASPATGVVALRPDSANRVRELASREANGPPSTSAASRGWDRYQQGDLEGAAEWLGKAAAEPNAHPWVHYALGYSELALRHPEKAARQWEIVRAAVPEFRAVYLDLADAYVQMDHLGNALDVLRAADARWSGDADVLNATGTIQVRRGALNDAIATFKKATESKPDDGIAHLNLARTYELRYFKTRRYAPTEGRWLANAADLRSAIASYEAYVRIGGPYESQAREAIEKLQWIK